MSFSWSVLALALIGADGQQPQQSCPPQPTNHAFTIAIKIQGPDAPRSPANRKTAAGHARKCSSETKAGPTKPGKSGPSCDPRAGETWPLTLREAVRIGLDNSEAVRVVAVGRQRAPANDAAPSAIVISRIDADAPACQFQGEMLAELRSIEQQYWNLSQARIQRWAADRAVSLAKDVLHREQVELAVGRSTMADVAEAAQRLEQFKLDLVTRASDVITCERALRNLIGLPPADNRRIVPVTEPTEAEFQPDWDSSLAQMLKFQPDVVEQRERVQNAEMGLLLARCSAETRQLLADDRDAAAPVQSDPAEAERLLLRSRADLQQVIHQTTHSLARFFLEIDANYKQMKTAARLRAAAARRLDAQRAEYKEGRITTDRYLGAIAQYAESVAAEARYKSAYNVSIVALEEARGTLLAHDNIIVSEGADRPEIPLVSRAGKDDQAKPASFEAEVDAETPLDSTPPRVAEILEHQAKATPDVPPACCAAEAETACATGCGTATKADKTWTFSIAIGGARPFRIEGTIVAETAKGPVDGER